MQHAYEKSGKIYDLCDIAMQIKKKKQFNNMSEVVL